MALNCNAICGQEARHDRSEAETRGPKTGHLALHGGGEDTSVRTFSIVEDLARSQLNKGDVLNVVIVPTAKSTYNDTISQRARLALLAMFRFSDKINLSCLHTRDRKVADSEEFCAPLKEAHLVLIPGGFARLLEDAYVGTRFQDSLWEVLDRGGVVAGGSAGAIIQSTITSRNTAGKAGFDLLTNSVVDVHVAERNRQDYLVKMFRNEKFDKERLLGIGIDEGVLAVVSQDILEVFGEGNVLIVNPREWKEGEAPLCETLSEGDRYDLKNRKRLLKHEVPAATGITN
ncbi:Type 1 glutamine amidotransferase-like domain-containing protein [bacterium]|nr:Type 1 glutamine amidotransferase-like domain-containing protein [bacterium]